MTEAPHARLIDTEVLDVAQHASTGALPSAERVVSLVAEAHDRYVGVVGGEVADYIPALASADPDLFGIVVTGESGRSFTAGDVDALFPIESISKAFLFALVAEEMGHRFLPGRIGVDNTGLPFDSVMALELNGGSPMNPLVNAGAITTTSLMSAGSQDERWEKVREGLSRFAGRELTINEEVYRSESDTNARNAALAELLRSYGRLGDDALDVLDVYTKQCSLQVTARDLAVMGATLAAGGVNPVTGEQVVSDWVCRDTLAVVASCGMYERSGQWMFEVGVPAKSGVAGGIVAVAPGKGAVGTYSPRLDAIGNSVRGQQACAFLARALGMNLFASTPRG